MQFPLQEDGLAYDPRQQCQARQSRACPALFAALILLAACAGDYRRAPGAPRSNAEMGIDLAACQNQAIFDDEVKAAAGSLLIGAFAGAAHGALAGAIHGGSAEGAAIGAAAGATIGFVTGLFSGDRDVDACMAGRGWTSG